MPKHVEKIEVGAMKRMDTAEEIQRLIWAKEATLSPMREGIADIYRRAWEAAFRGEVVAIKYDGETIALLRSKEILRPEFQMRDPDAKFRGKPLSSMSLAELVEIRDLTASHGEWFDSRDKHMERLTVIDEFIRAKKEAKDSQ